MIVRAQGKVVGEIKDGMFCKTVKGSKHMLKYPPAWCLDKESYDNDVKPNCSSIHIYDKESGITWATTVANFEANRCTLDRGHGEQYYMSLGDWTKC